MTEGCPPEGGGLAAPVAGEVDAGLVTVRRTCSETGRTLGGAAVQCGPRNRGPGRLLGILGWRSRSTDYPIAFRWWWKTSR